IGRLFHRKRGVEFDEQGHVQHTGQRNPSSPIEGGAFVNEIGGIMFEPVLELRCELLVVQNATQLPWQGVRDAQHFVEGLQREDRLHYVGAGWQVEERHVEFCRPFPWRRIETGGRQQQVVARTYEGERAARYVERR